MDDHLADLFELFPELEFQGPPSPSTQNYNCVAYSLGITNQWWQPSGGHPLQPGTMDQPYWHVADQDDDIGVYIEQFKVEGFEICQSLSFSPDFDLIALFDLEGEFRHVSKQLSDALWTSKFGDWEDLIHPLNPIKGIAYGEPNNFMRRKVRI